MLIALLVGLVVLWIAVEVWAARRRARTIHAVTFKVGPAFTTKGRFRMPLTPATQTDLTTTQRRPFRVEALNAGGQSVPTDGLPQIVVFDESICGVVLNTDGKSGFIVARAPGVTTITATFDADLGNGVIDVAGQLEVTVTADMAIQVRFLVDDAEPKPGE